jgi:ankyrin repeat protein
MMSIGIRRRRPHEWRGHAAIYGYADLLRYLISAGADVNHRNAEGQTAISLIEATPSLVNRRRRIVKILEQAGGVR